jgi:hypothetical protein
VGSVPALAATREYEIKAGFIYKCFRFVQWPNPGQTWTVGILGSDPFEADLRARRTITASDTPEEVWKAVTFHSLSDESLNPQDLLGL